MAAATPRWRGWRKLITAGAVLATVCAGAAPAWAGGGGVGTPDPPELSGVLCIEKCAGERIAAEGSSVRLDGHELGGTQKVRFAGDNGRIAVDPTKVSDSAVEAEVPAGAVTGTVRVDAYGATAETPADEPLKIVSVGQIPDAGGFVLSTAKASPRRSYFDGPRSPGLSFLFNGGAPADLRLEVTDRKTHEVVASWVEQDVEPNALHEATWDGRTPEGAPARNGDYRWAVANVAGGKAETSASARFAYHRFRFPLAAHHTYGDGYGAGRNHQGQDVFAKCGTPIHAVRGGRVQWNKVHPSAGNYLVVDGKGTGQDYMYAHLIHRSPLQRGDRVRTGQVIGQVGQTGNASGCHLHFEVWSAPGWYEGGSALPSVGKLLKTWDGWS